VKLFMVEQEKLFFVLEEALIGRRFSLCVFYAIDL